MVGAEARLRLADGRRHTRVLGPILGFLSFAPAAAAADAAVDVLGCDGDGRCVDTVLLLALAFGGCDDDEDEGVEVVVEDCPCRGGGRLSADMIGAGVMLFLRCASEGTCSTV